MSKKGHFEILIGIGKSKLSSGLLSSSIN